MRLLRGRSVGNAITAPVERGEFDHEQATQNKVYHPFTSETIRDMKKYL